MSAAAAAAGGDDAAAGSVPRPPPALVLFVGSLAAVEHALRRGDQYLSRSPELFPPAEAKDDTTKPEWLAAVLAALADEAQPDSAPAAVQLPVCGGSNEGKAWALLPARVARFGTKEALLAAAEAFPEKRVGSDDGDGKSKLDCAVSGCALVAEAAALVFALDDASVAASSWFDAVGDAVRRTADFQRRRALLDEDSILSNRQKHFPFVILAGAADVAVGWGCKFEPVKREYFMEQKQTRVYWRATGNAASVWNAVGMYSAASPRHDTIPAPSKEDAAQIADVIGLRNKRQKGHGQRHRAARRLKAARAERQWLRETAVKPAPGDPEVPLAGLDRMPTVKENGKILYAANRALAKRLDDLRKLGVEERRKERRKTFELMERFLLEGGPAHLYQFRYPNLEKLNFHIRCEVNGRRDRGEDRAGRDLEYDDEPDWDTVYAGIRAWRAMPATSPAFMRYMIDPGYQKQRDQNPYFVDTFVRAASRWSTKNDPDFKRRTLVLKSLREAVQCMHYEKVGDMGDAMHLLRIFGKMSNSVGGKVRENESDTPSSESSSSSSSSDSSSDSSSESEDDDAREAREAAEAAAAAAEPKVKPTYAPPEALLEMLHITHYVQQRAHRTHSTGKAFWYCIIPDNILKGLLAWHTYDPSLVDDEMFCSALAYAAENTEGKKGRRKGPIDFYIVAARKACGLFERELGKEVSDPTGEAAGRAATGVAAAMVMGEKLKWHAVLRRDSVLPGRLLAAACGHPKGVFGGVSVPKDLRNKALDDLDDITEDCLEANMSKAWKRAKRATTDEARAAAVAPVVEFLQYTRTLIVARELKPKARIGAAKGFAATISSIQGRRVDFVLSQPEEDDDDKEKAKRAAAKALCAEPLAALAKDRELAEAYVSLAATEHDRGNYQARYARKAYQQLVPHMVDVATEAHKAVYAGELNTQRLWVVAAAKPTKAKDLADTAGGGDDDDGGAAAAAAEDDPRDEGHKWFFRKPAKSDVTEEFDTAELPPKRKQYSLSDYSSSSSEEEQEEDSSSSDSKKEATPAPAATEAKTDSEPEKAPAASASAAAAASSSSSSPAPSTADKEHVFLPHSYMKPTKCEICDKLLLGIRKQGLRCQNCGKDIHQECRSVAGKCKA